MDPKGKVALVTGGAAGLGYAIALELLKQGAKGVSICDINVPKGQDSLKKLQQDFGKDKVTFIKTDVTKADEFEDAFRQTVKCFGGLDIVINNAGLNNDSIWRSVVDVNINGAIQGALLALKYLGKDQEGKGGVLVNLGSVAGLGRGIPITFVYNATKFAVVGLSHSLGAEYFLKTTGVRVLCICPGYTATELVGGPEKVITARKEWMPEFSRQLDEYPPPQSAENVGKAVIQMIREAKHGAFWVSELEKPPYEIVAPTLDKLAA